MTITKERLLKIKQWRETYGPGSNVVLPAEEAEELARIALASLEAGPVPDERDAFEAFMEGRFKDTIDRKRVKNGDQGYFAWDMIVAWIAWQGRAAILQGADGNSPVIPDGWVACSERMPEENAEQEVLACFKGGDISTLYYFEGRWDDAYGIVPIRQDVTHWMPLPAAPQQEA